jgi:nucleotide-binding universal stress UspA family protein
MLLPVLAWVPPGGDLNERRYPSIYLRELWKQAAWDRLWQAIDLGLGGLPADLVVRPDVLRGPAGPVLVRAASEPGDLLVIGAGRRGGIGGVLARQVSRYCLAHACCPVVAVPPPSLREAAHGVRGWALRHRGLTPEHARLGPAGA